MMEHHPGHFDSLHWTREIASERSYHEVAFALALFVVIVYGVDKDEFLEMVSISV